MNPLISVIVPVYKVEQYLDECVQSIVHQTYSNLEIILVDDGSTDRCPEMCDEYARQDSRIKVIHKKNGGLSSARNAGLEIATGEYIGFVDSDDYIAPDMYEILCANILDDENIALVSSQIFQFSDVKISPFVPKKWETITNRRIQAKTYIHKIIIDDVNITCWNKLYKASVIASVRFLDGRNNEDFLFNYEVAKAIYKSNYYVFEICDYLYFYRYNELGIKNSKTKPLEIDSVKNSLYVLHDISDFSEEFLFDAKCRFVSVASNAYSRISSNNIWRKEYLQSLRTIIKSNRKGMSHTLKLVGIRHKLMFFIIWYFPIFWDISFIKETCTKRGDSIPTI